MLYGQLHVKPSIQLVSAEADQEKSFLMGMLLRT